MHRSGAELFHQTLIEQGVEIMFGYPGGAILPTFDVFHETPIRFVLTRHEQGAGHMADGYARATGKVGVAVVTSGPGATNLVTALATAHMDSIPIVAFTGQVATAAIGNDAFQEADVTGVTRPVTKHNVLVKRVEDLPRIVKEAFHIASTGRPGPVLVDLPKDIQVTKIPVPAQNGIDLPGYKPRAKGNMRQVRMAAEVINASQRPVLYVGGGVILSGATDVLREVARKGTIPVTTTLMGMGAFDEVADDTLALHMLGMHGSAYANYSVQNCDLLIAVGSRFDDRVTGRLETFAPHAKIIHIDIDPSSISKNVDVDIPVVGDAQAILAEILPLIEPRDRGPWLQQIAEWKRKYPLAFDRNSSRIKPQFVVEQLCEATNSEAIVATGVGQHQMWAAQFYRWRFPRQMITSGGLGTMGFGFPAAIGAALGRPDRPVIDIDGDGSFAMTLMELSTAVQENVPVKTVILNNHFQGMVRQWQELFYDRRYVATRMQNPDFAEVARAFGATGLRVKAKDELRDAIEQMLKVDGPVVLDVDVDPDENVYPMVATGKGLHEMAMGGLS
ncbi:MAG: biosynthetic-type acetolactate synthase large subunit [Phycisphaerae bacterium]|nr:biosynthetic-type acetolactate synthase large subunit [Phycisphaerae bacterium]